MNSCREPPSKQLLPVLPQKDCLSSVKLNSLQASEETTSSLTVKPSEPQASCCFCYKPPERLAWAGTGLEPEESRFPHCLHYLPRVQEQVWAWGHCRVRNAPEIFFFKKRGGVIIHSWFCHLYNQVHFPPLRSVSAFLKWERWSLKSLWERTCSASLHTVRSVFWVLLTALLQEAPPWGWSFVLRRECWQLAYGVWMKTERNAVLSVFGTEPWLWRVLSKWQSVFLFLQFVFLIWLSEREVSKASPSAHSLQLSEAPQPSPTS